MQNTQRLRHIIRCVHITFSVGADGLPQIEHTEKAISPVATFKGAAVFGIVVEFSHALLKDVSDLTLLQKRLSQLILSIHKCLTDTQSHSSQIKESNVEYIK